MNKLKNFRRKNLKNKRIIKRKIIKLINKMIKSRYNKLNNLLKMKEMKVK
jgi:hypothetical protein